MQHIASLSSWTLQFPYIRNFDRDCYFWGLYIVYYVLDFVPDTEFHAPELDAFEHLVGGAALGQATVLLPISPSPGVFYFLQLSLLFFHWCSVIAAADRIIRWYLVWRYYGVVLCIRYCIYSICILHLIVVQINADIWFQSSSVRSIRTKLLEVCFSSPISSIDRNISPHSHFHASHSVWCPTDHQVALDSSMSMQDLPPYHCGEDTY